MDSTSPNTSALRGPYLTFTSWPGLVSHANLGEWPLSSSFSLYLQVTHWLGANAPLASGPALRSTEGMSVCDQTPARRMASCRSCGVERLPGRKALDVGTSAERQAQPEEDHGAAPGEQGLPPADPGRHGR